MAFAGEIPTAIVPTEPDLLAGLAVYLDAFFDLSSERPPAMEGVVLIPWSSIQNYAVQMGFDDYESLNRFHHCINSMDLFYVNRANSKLEADRKKAAAKAKRKSS